MNLYTYAYIHSLLSLPCSGRDVEKEKWRWPGTLETNIYVLGGKYMGERSWWKRWGEKDSRGCLLGFWPEWYWHLLSWGGFKSKFLDELNWDAHQMWNERCWVDSWMQIWEVWIWGSWGYLCFVFVVVGPQGSEYRLGEEEMRTEAWASLCVGTGGGDVGTGGACQFKWRQGMHLFLLPHLSEAFRGQAHRMRLTQHRWKNE